MIMVMLFVNSVQAQTSTSGDAKSPFDIKPKSRKTDFKVNQDKEKDKKQKEQDARYHNSERKYESTFYKKKKKYIIHTVFDPPQVNDDSKRYKIHTVFDPISPKIK